MVSQTLALLAAILVVAVLIFLQVWRTRRAIRAHESLDSDALSSAIGETWREMDFDRTVVELENHADEISEFHADIAQLLRHPQQRGDFGEQQLDVLLGDHLPPELYGLREQVVDGKTPDAYIESAAGHVCIDSKFPLDNYESYLQADDEEAREKYRRKFRKDVDRQLEKIATDYVRPSRGTADFAFAFIPSESVYYHLATEEYDLLRAYTKRGVQVVSPLTLGHKLELIRADVHARQLSEQADDILSALQRLGEQFDAVEDEWGTLYGHLRNAKRKADEVNQEYDALRTEFSRIEQPSVDSSAED
jgi:DNA recombination protein RmuC